jgi:hypothetical protein
MADPFNKVLTKYEWAKKHVDNFEVAVDHFRRSNPHTVRRKDNVQAGYVTYCVENVPVIPDELPLMLGDAIHNLRSTLDYLARELVVVAGGTPDKYTSFPIFDSAKAYVELSRSKVPSLRQPCLEILDRIQPYKGAWGNKLWQLHQLDIVDKHRLLLTIATVPVGHTMVPSQKAAFDARGVAFDPEGIAVYQYLFAAYNPRVKPLQAGDEIGTFLASDVDENMGFSFDVAFNEPDIIEGLIPTFAFLRMVCSEVLIVINEFGPCL